MANTVHPWREVFASLLTQVDLNDIDSENYGRSEQIKRIAALRKWKTKHGRSATYEILVRALLNIGKVDQAETLCSQLQALQGTVALIVYACKPSSAANELEDNLNYHSDNIMSNWGCMYLI